LQDVSVSLVAAKTIRVPLGAYLHAGPKRRTAALIHGLISEPLRRMSSCQLLMHPQYACECVVDLFVFFVFFSLVASGISPIEQVSTTAAGREDAFEAQRRKRPGLAVLVEKEPDAFVALTSLGSLLSLAHLV
jgi:hypothetical protein